MELILASTSPRRRELLATLGLEFAVEPGASLDESEVLSNSEGSLTQRLAQLAQLKGAEIAAEQPSAVVLSADTVVEINGEILGKPRDTDEARAMLTRLSGHEHRVHTGVAVQRIADDFRASGCETTGVFFARLAAETIEQYISHAEPYDKAGAYGIQGLGALLVERIDGDYSNVVGLPLPLTCRLLAAAGISVLG
jgi:septum formation protein